MMDAAASLASTVESAQDSFDDLTANGNLSNTALQQAQVAAALTQGRINAAVAQVLAYQAVEQANQMQQAEIDRLERLAEWRDARLRTNAMADAMRTAAFQNRDRLREGLLFKIPSFYMGGQVLGPGSDCHATRATAVDRSERPGPDPGGSAPGLQGVPGRRARHRGRRRGARSADARPPALGRSRGDRRRLERPQDRLQRHARAVGARACRARDRDPPDAAPLLQRPDPGRGLHLPGHGRGRRDLAPEPVHLRRRVRRLHGDDRAGAGVRRTARRGMVRRKPDDRRDRGSERLLLVSRFTR